MREWDSSACSETSAGDEDERANAKYCEYSFTQGPACTLSKARGRDERQGGDVDDLQLPVPQSLPATVTPGHPHGKSHLEYAYAYSYRTARNTPRKRTWSTLSEVDVV